MRAGEELECVHAGGASGDGNQRIKKETMHFCGWEERETRDQRYVRWLVFGLINLAGAGLL